MTTKVTKKKIKKVYQKIEAFPPSNKQKKILHHIYSIKSNECIICELITNNLYCPKSLSTTVIVSEF